MLTISVKYFQTAYIFSLVSPFLFPAQEKFSACPETLILLFYNFGIEVYTCKCFLPHKHTKSNIDASKRHLEGITKAHPWKNVKNREEKMWSVYCKAGSSQWGRRIMVSSGGLLQLRYHFLW